MQLFEAGHVILDQPAGSGSIHQHWKCIHTKGWYGFWNRASGSYLGYDKLGNICCSAHLHREWEHYHLEPKRDGGYILLMRYREKFWHESIRRVGTKMEGHREILATLDEESTDGIPFEFVKI